MKSFSQLKSLIKHQGAGGALGGMNIGLIAVVSCTLAVVASAFVGVAKIDSFLYENPDYVENANRIGERMQKDFALRMEFNPWGRQNTSDPASFLASVFSSVDPELAVKLLPIFKEMDEKKLRYFSFIFSSIELTPEQLIKIAGVLNQVLSGERGLQKLAVLADIAKGALESKISGQAAQTSEQSKKDSLGPEGVAETETGEVLEVLVTELIEIKELDSKEMAEVMANILTEVEPQTMDQLLSVIADLPPALGRKVSALIGALASTDSEKLVFILDRLSTQEIKPVVNNLARLSRRPVSTLVSRFENSTSPQVVMASKIIAKIAISLAEKLIVLTEDFSNKSFYSAMDIVKNLGQSHISKFVSVGEKLSSREMEGAVQMLSRVSASVQKKALEVMDKVTPQYAAKLVIIAGKIPSQNDLKKGLEVLFSIQNLTIQEKGLDIWENLDQNNLKRSIDVLDTIKTSSIRNAITISYKLSERAQNELFENVDRIVLKEKKTRIKRIELTVDKLARFGDDKLTSDLIRSADPLNDKALNQAVDVFLAVDDKHTKGAIRTMTRLNVRQRTEAVDTMDDIKIKHLHAAIDIVETADNKLLRDSVTYVTNLKGRLNRKDALETSMRAISVASRVKSTKERQSGLNALREERAVKNRRILKQVDGQTKVFDGKTVRRITEEYHKLEEPKARKFSNILAGSTGLTLGAKIGAGAARSVTQDRKILRIDQYFSGGDDNPEKLQSRIDFISSRPIFVDHSQETSFSVKNPVAVAGVRGKTLRKKFNIKRVEE